METNDVLRKTLLSLAEAGIKRLILSLEGDLQELEQQMLVQMFALGRTYLEQILEQRARREGAAARREGRCGHRQRLVGTRPRQLVTLLGPITTHRVNANPRI